jgi:hypothetical protein
MLEIVGAIAPVFATIVLGHVLSRTLLASAEFWAICDRLTYWVLFPALLFNTISVTPLDARFLGPYALVLIGGFLAAVAFALAAGRLAGLPGPVASSLLQGAARHNTFIALAVAERLHGASSLAIAALASSILIPITNVVVVVAMVMLHPSSREIAAGRAIARDLARNPLILAVVIGLIVNVAGLARLPVLHETTGVLGRAALPVVLLSIGAGIRLGELTDGAGAMTLALVGKLVVFPLAILALALATGLDRQAALIALIFGTVPTASSAYALARQMGGDAPLMARIVTTQTLVAFVTMPLMLVLAAWWLG